DEVPNMRDLRERSACSGLQMLGRPHSLMPRCSCVASTHQSLCSALSGPLPIFWAPVPGLWHLPAAARAPWVASSRQNMRAGSLWQRIKRMESRHSIMPLFRAVRTKRSQPGIMGVTVRTLSDVNFHLAVEQLRAFHVIGANSIGCLTMHQRRLLCLGEHPLRQSTTRNSSAYGNSGGRPQVLDLSLAACPRG